MKYTPDQLKEILEFHAKWASGDGGTRADLSGAHLSGANLYGAILSGAHLYGADLSGANLSGANLSRADLSGANLSSANLSSANLSGAHLYGADLSGANLSGAHLYGANLSRAKLYGANLSGAHLYGANLYGANIEGLIARSTRIIDPYEFFAWRTDNGDFIKAGCQFMTVAQYRDHVASDYPDTPKADETLRILDFIEAAFAATPRKTKEVTQ